jgi:hypothetical protein
MARVLNETKKKFKQFCLDKNLRYKLDDCNDPISPTRKRVVDDHLYWIDHPTKIGVYIQRDSKLKFTRTKTKLISLGCVLNQDGDYDGTFFVTYKKAMRTARYLGVAKNKFSTEKRKAARERMKKLWESGKMGRKKKETT